VAFGAARNGAGSQSHQTSEDAPGPPQLPGRIVYGVLDVFSDPTNIGTTGSQLGAGGIVDIAKLPSLKNSTRATSSPRERSVSIPRLMSVILNWQGPNGMGVLS
jgi:hypothetical protein